ncbi:UbiX family flavin prenyltransferase [Castellaniella sp.]|uniref:UbiX family flavin prenyltransferase n=1 Tax=Castellaniella sp. TaxID=1955812 RepID=UPI00355CAE4E
MRSADRRLIVGISGASGAIYGVRALEMLQAQGIATHLVISKSAQLTLFHELGLRPADLEAKVTVLHHVNDIGASISSGSFRTEGMLIAPCSVRSMAEIATGITSSLLTRAADVTLKERRRLVLMLRETPLHLGHIRSMAAVTEAGAIVMPPVPALYTKPTSLDEVITHSVARALDLFDIDTKAIPRWSGLQAEK